MKSGNGDIARVWEGAHAILEKHGVRVDCEKLRGELLARGCMEQGERVAMPREVVLAASAKIRKKFVIQSPAGRRVTFAPGATLFHASGGMPFILDTGATDCRAAKVDDYRRAIRLTNALENIDMPCYFVYPEDADNRTGQVDLCREMLELSEKPFFGLAASTPLEARHIAEMMLAASGGREGMREAPCGTIGLSPVSPLHFPRTLTDAMAHIVGAGIPTVPFPAPVAGLTAPVTVAGATAQMMAEMMAYVMIASVYDENAAVLFGPRLAFANMKKGLSVWGLPEVGIASALATRMSEVYGYSSDAYGLCCTSCCTDVQAGYEKALNAAAPLAAGAVSLSGAGSLASLTVASFEQLAIDNELIAMLKRGRVPLDTSDTAFAFEEYERILGGETFLEQPHTAKNLRKGVQFAPKLGFDSLWPAWRSEGEPIVDKAARTIEKILAEASAWECPYDLKREFEKICAAATREAG